MPIDPKYIDPITGRIKPFQEYAGQIKHDAGPVSLSPETMPAWFNADGSPKPLSQIRDERAKAELADRIVAAQVAARMRRELSEDERLVQSLDTMIEKSSKEAKYSTTPQERVRHQEYADTLKARKAEVENKIKDEKRIADLANDRRVQLCKEYAETYQRTLPIGVTPEQAALATALANRTDCDPDTLVREFWVQAALNEAASLKAAEATAADKQELALRHGHEHAMSEVAVAESRKRLHDAQQQAGVNDVQQDS
jgi:hypothetical protein